MTDMTDAQRVALLLTNRLVDTGVQPYSSKDFWRLLGRVPDLADLLDGGSAGAADRERIDALLSASVAFAMQVEDLERRGVALLSALHEGYPTRLRERLGPKAPPLLYAAGATVLLGEDGVGVVGSRDVGDAGAAAAEALGRQAAAIGVPVVSGGARGVDTLAMEAALSAGGRAVGVLAESLLRRVRIKENRDAILDERLCLVTPYKPNAPFNTGNAMGRNKLIYALCEATVVIATADGEGGTWAGAVEAMKLGLPVAVWLGQGAGPGNSRLVELGARPIERVEDAFAARTPGGETTADEPAAESPSGTPDNVPAAAQQLELALPPSPANSAGVRPV